MRGGEAVRVIIALQHILPISRFVGGGHLHMGASIWLHIAGCPIHH